MEIREEGEWRQKGRKAGRKTRRQSASKAHAITHICIVFPFGSLTIQPKKGDRLQLPTSCGVVFSV